MYNLVGLGKAGCNLVEKLSSYGNYKCFYISSAVEKRKDSLLLPTYDTPEEYENFSQEKLENFAKKINGNIHLFLTGDSLTSGITLRFLEKVKMQEKDINIVYITPEVSLLSGDLLLQERLVRNVLQQYSRSAVFNNILLLSNTYLEEVAGETTLMSYYEDLNTVAADAYNILNVFKNSKSISNTFFKIPNISRICTLGVFDLENNYEKMFFPLENIKEVVYYFGINEEKLKTEKNLFRKITNFISNKKTQYGEVSFGIYPTSYPSDVGYVEYFSSEIQEKTFQ